MNSIKLEYEMEHIFNDLLNIVPDDWAIRYTLEFWYREMEYTDKANLQKWLITHKLAPVKTKKGWESPIYYDESDLVILGQLDHYCKGIIRYSSRLEVEEDLLKVLKARKTL